MNLAHLALLALRTVLRGRPRAWIPMLALAAAACALALGAGLGAVLASTACVAAANAELHTLARRRELATLRALGMAAPVLVWMLALEALWITFLGMLAGSGAAVLATWLGQRIAGLAQPLPGQGATLAGSAALLGTALLAALPAAIRSARRDIAAGLALLPADQQG